MHTAEMILAFRLAEEQGYVNNVVDYAACYGHCPSCPANSTCEYLSGPALNNDIFKSNFDSLVRPHLQKYTMQYIKSYHPELFI